MKKTIIAIFALSGVVTAAESFDTSNSITLNPAIALGTHTASFKWADLKTNANTEKQLKNLLAESGYSSLTLSDTWHYFAAGSNEDSSKASYSFADGSHVLKKGSANATILTYSLSVSELFSSDYASGYEQTITGLTFANTTSSVGDAYYTAFSITADGAVTCLTTAGITNNQLGQSPSFSVSGLQLGADDTIMILYRQGNDTATTITGLTISATGTAEAVVPEPATATLSLLALAGLAIRRRRK